MQAKKQLHLHHHPFLLAAEQKMHHPFHPVVKKQHPQHHPFLPVVKKQHPQHHPFHPVVKKQHPQHHPFLPVAYPVAKKQLLLLEAKHRLLQ